jgi:hypothetical protein
MGLALLGLLQAIVLVDDQRAELPERRYVAHIQPRHQERLRQRGFSVRVLRLLTLV